jgi:NitT/TauT family transport system ATP-binding protein
VAVGEEHTTDRGLTVEIDRATRVFRAPGQAEVTAVDEVSLHVASGEFVAIVGPSGCGKSTLLRMVAGLDRPGRGERQALAYVFQDAHLLPWRSVVDNVGLPLELAGADKATSRGEARTAIEHVGIGEAAERYPAQLSGGMRMRASLARALVARPRVLLLDEPFGALDEITRHGLQVELRRLWHATGITVLFVTHSISEATFLSERVVVLTPRPARVVVDHPVALPSVRDGALRTDAAFAAEMRVLQEALRRGGVST